MTLIPEPDRSSKIKGRLAPSPTGGLHLGNARTFLIAWLLARKSGGSVVFRMEDLDATRARADASQAALEDLRSLGLDWDEGPDTGGPNGPYVQSERSAIYEDALDQLIQKDLVYPCTCTRSDIARAASAPHAEDMPVKYPGTCSQHSSSKGLEYESQGVAFAWRFRCEDQFVIWTDNVRGPQEHRLDAIGGDFVLARSGGVFSYQLAVVVDDALMGVTQVVRGRDLVESTPRQVLLQQALNLPRPDYWHVGLVMGPDGKRLAKRDQAVKLAFYRDQNINVTGRLLESLGRADIRAGQPAEMLAEALSGWTLEPGRFVTDVRLDS